MRSLTGTPLSIYLLMAQAASAQVLPTSTTTSVNDVDCGGLKLVAATGVPTAPTRAYKFHGICKILVAYPKTGSLAGYEWSEDTEIKVLASTWTDVVVTWNPSTGYLKEDAQTQSPYAGHVSMQLRCAEDPVLTNSGCTGISYANTTHWSGFDRAYAVPRPISRGKTTLAEATALSSQQTASAGSNTPPPPPPPQAPSSTIRATVPTGSEPVAVASPQIVVSPTRTSPSPSPAPPPEGGGEIALVPAVQIELQDGRAIVADQSSGSLRWAMVGPQGQLLRRFPSGSKLSEKGKHGITLEWPGGSYHAGKRAGERGKKAR